MTSRRRRGNVNVLVREEFKNHGVSMSYNHINVNMISDAVKEKD